MTKETLRLRQAAPPKKKWRIGATLRQAESIGLPWKVGPRRPSSKHLAKPENRRTLFSRVTTAAVELLLFTGCRLSEVLNLRWDQVDFETGTITLAETKAGRAQVVVSTGATGLKAITEL